MSARPFPQRDVPRIIALFRAGRLPVDQLLTHRAEARRHQRRLRPAARGRRGQAGGGVRLRADGAQAWRGLSLGSIARRFAHPPEGGGKSPSNGRRPAYISADGDISASEPPRMSSVAVVPPSSRRSRAMWL